MSIYLNIQVKNCECFIVSRLSYTFVTEFDLHVFVSFLFTEAELQQRAFNLSLSALLGHEVYNFGELVIFTLFFLHFLIKFSIKLVFYCFCLFNLSFCFQRQRYPPITFVFLISPNKNKTCI